MAIRIGLVKEVVVMAFDTVRTNKMRSFLTVLGVVIGITSIVGMTAMIRGFDQSLREMIGAIGPNTIFVQRFGDQQLRRRRRVQGADQAAEPVDLRRTRARGASRDDPVRRHRARRGRPADTAPRLLRHAEDQVAHRLRHDRELRRRHEDPVPERAVLQRHRSPVPQERRRARQHAVQAAVRAERDRSRSARPVRVGSERFEVVGTFDKRPAAGGFNLGQDDFVVIPYTTYQRIFGLNPVRIGPSATILPIQIALVPREGVPQAEAMADVERVMRIRHGLKLDQPNDFDLLTQDAVPQAVGSDQPGHVLRARRDLVDRADGRRYRRDGDHVDLGDRADARDRRAQGTRRAPRARSSFSS